MRESVKVSTLRILHTIPLKDKETIFSGLCVELKSYIDLRRSSGLRS